MKKFIQYDIYMPRLDSKGKPYARSIFPELKKELIDFYGGITENRQKHLGTWKLGSLEVRDEIWIWTILSDKGGTGERFMAGFRKTAERELKQKELLVTRSQTHQI